MLNKSTLKNIFINFLLSITLLPCFAEYKPIPKSQTQKYHIEIERAIQKNYKPTLLKINKIEKNAHNFYVQLIKTPKDKELYNKFYAEQFDTTIDAPEFYLYKNLIEITKKYVDIENDIPASDFSGKLYDFLFPYLKDNKIDIKKLSKISNYSAQKQKQIIKYYKCLSPKN